jgi:Tfp pilus assembly protein PilF
LAAALQLHLGQPEAAQALLDQIRPDHWRGAAVRALIYEAHSDADRACGAMAAAAALAPDHAKTHYTVEHGRMGLRVGRLREARTAFEAALELDATRSDAWRGLARARQRLGDRRGARRAFRKARANKG